MFAQTSAPVINASSCEKPAYPSASKRLEEEGTVQLKFLVDVNGKVIESVVEKSSGFRRLDEAAREGLSKCAFKPPIKDGVALQSWASMKYTWRLENSLCVGSDVSKWMSCQGTLATSSGGLIVVEYKAGKKNGRGIEYDAIGKVIRAGIFDGENLVSEQNLDPKLYPFIAQLPANSANQSVNMAAVQPDISSSNLPACPSSGYFHNCFGTSTYDDMKYVGEWKENEYNGQGTLSFSNGVNYVGEWRNGNLNGYGTVIFPNGVKYVGELKDSKYNGQGTLFAPNGSIINQGIWADNKFVRSETVQQASVANQTVAIVPVQPNTSQSNLPPCPQASLKTNCWGEAAYRDGRKYVGEFLNSKFHGKGIEFNSDGSVLRSGAWSQGNFVGSISIQQASSAIQSAPAPEVLANNAERGRLLAEVEAERKKRQELEEQLRVAQLRPVPSQTASSTSLGKRIALVVGNANYKVRSLKNAKNDADDVSRSLKTSGFEVIDLRDATLPQMRSAVRQFGDRLVNNDVGLVYYSGHGVEVKGRNYFIPVNADIQREDEIADQGLDVSLILEKMSTAGKGVNILIVDACRDDPFGRSFRSSSRGLANMDAPRGTIIAYATSPGKVASDGDPRERNSPYTKHLVKAMQSPNKPIEQVFKEVRRAVQDETKNQQTPWENTSLSGDFFFKVQR